jgi:hypothetical protein
MRRPWSSSTAATGRPTVELPELVRHASVYAAAAREAGETAQYVAMENCTHFSVLEDLAQPAGTLMSALIQDRCWFPAQDGS